MEIIPSTAATWLEEAKKANVQKTSIHSLDDLNSGSKLNEKQFLALRAIWKQEKRNKFSPDSWGLPIPEARELLAKNKDWKSFLSHVTSRTPTSYTVPKVGTFSSSWDLLQQIRDYPRTAPSATKVLFSPAGPKTRSRQEQKAPRRDPYTTPSRPQTTIDEAMGDIAIDMPSWEESSDLMGSFMLESEANSPVTKEEAKTLFPPLDDEPTVNACLIVFLNAVCFHHRGLGMHWSMQQKAFNFGSGGSVFEARVDGYLRAKSDRSKRSKVIAEVKPYARADRKDVRFQETAQMAAWIFAEPDKTSKSGKYARIIISQDRHEIYITIAEYDGLYIKYLKDELLPGDDRLALMTMNQYGPWLVDSSRDMERLGEIILALALEGGVVERRKVKGARKKWVPAG